MSNAMEDFDAAVARLVKIDEALAMATLHGAIAMMAERIMKRYGCDESEELLLETEGLRSVTVHAKEKST